MAQARNPRPVKLFCGMLAGDPAIFSAVAQELEEQYGEIDAESDTFAFDFSDYYEPEMGPNLKKKFVSFRRLIDPGEIVEVKLRTNEMEKEIAAAVGGSNPRPQGRHGQTSLSVPPLSLDSGAKTLGVPRSSRVRAGLFERAGGGSISRPINLDPGYLTLSKLVLATAKDYSHRLYLDRGIYVEVTLRYKGGEFVEWPWTYPDYKTPEYHAFFKRLREIYITQLKEFGPIEGY